MSDFVGVADGYVPGTEPSSGGLCGPWLTADDMRPGDCAVCPAVDDATPDDDTINDQIRAASEYLNAMAGFAFPGVCNTTVRPCAPSGREGGLWAWAPIPYELPQGIWPVFGGGCGGCGGAWGGCGCCGPTAFALGHIPILEVTQVKLGGEVLTEDVDYRLVDNLLARLDPDDQTNPAYWPSCQNLAADDDQPGTMSVTFNWGIEPPASGVMAARDLACMLIGAQCGDEACRPAQRLTQKVAGGTTLQFISPDAEILNQLPNSVRLFLDAFGTPMRRTPKVRHPQAGTGYIWNTPVSAQGYGRWGGMFGAGCQGCS